jgi:hypothetical protein
MAAGQQRDQTQAQKDKFHQGEGVRLFHDLSPPRVEEAATAEQYNRQHDDDEC